MRGCLQSVVEGGAAFFPLMSRKAELEGGREGRREGGRDMRGCLQSAVEGGAAFFSLVCGEAKLEGGREGGRAG